MFIWEFCKSLLNNRASFFAVFSLLLCWGVFAFSATVVAKMPSAALRIEKGPLTIMKVDVVVEKDKDHAETVEEQAFAMADRRNASNHLDCDLMSCRAVAQAQREALRRFAERRMSPEAFGNYSLPEDNLVTEIVDVYEIRKEKYDSTRYEATFNVRFRPRVLEYINLKKIGALESHVE